MGRSNIGFSCMIKYVLSKHLQELSTKRQTDIDTPWAPVGAQTVFTLKPKYVCKPNCKEI